MGRLSAQCAGCAMLSEGSPSDSAHEASSAAQKVIGSAHADGAQPTESPATGQNNFQGLHAGYVLIASVLLGLGLGYGLDLLIDSFPWGMIGGAAFFIVAGLYQVVKEFTK